MSNLPRVSKKATAAAARDLAVIKYLLGRLKNEEKSRKEYLCKALTEGSKITSYVGEQVEVATISRSKPRTIGGLAITDMDAFIKWCEKEMPSAPITITKTLPDWFIKRENLECIANERGGEIPAGVEMVSETKPGVITVRQTPTQEDNLVAYHQAVRLISQQLKQLEGAVDGE